MINNNEELKYRPLFSIIIPVFNAEDYLKTCLDSIVKQSYSNYELILINDGATDKSGAICDEYAKNYNNIFVLHKKNEGLVAARQDGYKIAKGEYITSIDDDDYVSPDYFSHLESIIKRYNPDWIYFNHTDVYNGTSKDGILEIDEGFYEKSDVEKRLFPFLIHSKKDKYFEPNIWSKVFKREIFLKTCFIDKRITIGEDYLVVIPSVINSESLFVTNKKLYYYRINDSSITHNKAPFDINYPIYARKQLEKSVDLSSFDFKEQVFRRTTRDVFNAFYSQFYTGESYSKVIKKFQSCKQNKMIAESINNCTFTSIILRLVKFTLKHNLFFLLYLYSKFM